MIECAGSSAILLDAEHKSGRYVGKQIANAVIDVIFT